MTLPWLRLFRQASLDFEMLPSLTQGVAWNILRMTDDDGVIYHGPKATLLDAYKHRYPCDRAATLITRRAIERLIENGFIVAEKTCVKVPNFQRFQELERGRERSREVARGWSEVDERSREVVERSREVARGGGEVARGGGVELNDCAHLQMTELDRDIEGELEGDKEENATSYASRDFEPDQLAIGPDTHHSKRMIAQRVIRKTWARNHEQATAGPINAAVFERDGCSLAHLADWVASVALSDKGAQRLAVDLVNGYWSYRDKPPSRIDWLIGKEAEMAKRGFELRKENNYDERSASGA